MSEQPLTPRGSLRRPLQVTAALVIAAAVLAGMAIADGGSATPVAEERLVFTAFNGPSQDLFVQTPGGAPVPLTEDEFRDGQARFSPDGRRIAFASDRGGNLDIWLINADGSEPRRLTSDPGSDLDPAWGPDGRQIAFVSDREGDRTNIFVVELASGHVTQITFQQFGLAFVDWSPDGEWFVYSTAGPPDATDPNLTPLQLEVIPASGGESAIVRAGPGLNWGAAWSPDGERIAFAWTRAGAGLIDAAWLQVINRDGSGLRRLQPGFRGDYSPSWAPDGKRIAFTSTRDGAPQVFIWDLETDNVSLALGGMTAFDASWAPRR